MFAFNIILLVEHSFTITLKYYLIVNILLFLVDVPMGHPAIIALDYYLIGFALPLDLC